MPWEDELGFDDDDEEDGEQRYFDHGFSTDFDLFSVLSKPKVYYKILEVDFNATEEIIRSNYIRLALKWHPDKRGDKDCATSRFQEINEAYRTNWWYNYGDDTPHSKDMAIKILSLTSASSGCEDLIDPIKRREYDKKGIVYIQDYNVTEYLNRYKSLILTCNGLGVRYSIW